MPRLRSDSCNTSTASSMVVRRLSTLRSTVLRPFLKHRVPLCGRAIEILNEARTLRGDERLS